jgi:hypothetical protein
MGDILNCPYCNYTNPDGIGKCLRCDRELVQFQGSGYSGVIAVSPQPHQPPPQPYPQPYPQQQFYEPPLPLPGYELSNWDNKWFVFLFASLLSLIGFFMLQMLLTIGVFPPVLGTVIIYLVIAMPLIGGVLTLLGHFRAGGVLLMIIGIITLPAGFIGLLAGYVALRLGRIKNYYDTTGIPLPRQLVKRFTTPNRRMVNAGIIAIILLLVLPGIYIGFFVMRPELKIQIVDIESQDDTTMNVMVKIKNDGDAVAEAQYIEVEFVLTSQTRRYDWPEDEYSIWEHSGEVVYYEIPINPGDELKEVSVFYYGAKIDTYKM